MLLSSLIVLFCFVISFSCTDSHQSCPNNWIVYDNRCFYVGLKTKTWSEAKSSCQSLGGSLLVVDNSQEWDDIHAHAVRLVFTWIGLKNGANNVTSWVSDSKMPIEAMPWLIKTSDHGKVKGNDCVSYFGTANPLNAYIQYSNCDLEMYYMCTKKSN